MHAGVPLHGAELKCDIIIIANSCSKLQLHMKVLQLDTEDVPGDKSNTISCYCDGAVRILWDISHCGVYMHCHV